MNMKPVSKLHMLLQGQYSDLRVQYKKEISGQQEVVQYFLEETLSLVHERKIIKQIEKQGGD